jgi:hypothetical protein
MAVPKKEIKDEFRHEGERGEANDEMKPDRRIGSTLQASMRGTRTEAIRRCWARRCRLA